MGILTLSKLHVWLKSYQNGLHWQIKTVQLICKCLHIGNFGPYLNVWFESYQNGLFWPQMQKFGLFLLKIVGYFGAQNLVTLMSIAFLEHFSITK